MEPGLHDVCTVPENRPTNNVPSKLDSFTAYDIVLYTFMSVNRHVLPNKNRHDKA